MTSQLLTALPLADVVVGQGVLGVIILVADVVAVVSVLTGHGTLTHKVLWTALILLLPILGQLRQTMGIATAAPSNAIGDILRLLPSVRDWVPAEGRPLRLGLVEVKNKPSVKDLLKKLEAEKSPLARLRRIKSVNVWELDPDALAKVLGK